MGLTGGFQCDSGEPVNQLAGFIGILQEWRARGESRERIGNLAVVAGIARVRR